MPNTLIKIQNVTKRFGEHTVLDKIDLDVRTGEIFGIIGMSGSGKTTFLNSLIGFLEPDEGDILFKMEHLLEYDDNDQFRSVFQNSSDVKKSFGFASQTPSFYQKLTCAENLEHFGTMYSLSEEVICSNTKILLKLMNLYESKDILAQNLSGGMQKRLDIACALVHDPKLLILDEPTADLDPVLRKQMWELIKKINAKGTTIIISSHFLDEVDTLCDRISILHTGKIVTVGTNTELKSMHKRTEEIHIETLSGKFDIIAKDLKGTPGIHIDSLINKGHKLIIKTKQSEPVLHKLIHLLEVNREHLLDIKIIKPTLEEVFEDLTNTEIKKGL